MLREKIASVGNHFLIGLRPSPVLDDHDRALLSDLRPAGVILFKSNFRHDVPYEAWLESHARLIADIRAATGQERLLIAIDHEGGRVCRTPLPITRFAYAARWAGHAAELAARWAANSPRSASTSTSRPCSTFTPTPKIR